MRIRSIHQFLYNFVYLSDDWGNKSAVQKAGNREMQVHGRDASLPKAGDPSLYDMQGTPILVLPCVVKEIDTMKTARDMRKPRLAIFAALAEYFEDIFREKAKEHHVNYKWFLLLFPGYLMYILVSSLVMYIYILIYEVPEDDFTAVNLTVSTQIYYLIFVLLRGRPILKKLYEERPLSEAPFYLRAYFLHSAVEFAYLQCFNRLVGDKNDDLSVSKEEQKLLRKAAKTIFWPTDTKMPWELKMPKLTFWQRVKNAFWLFIGFHDKLPLRWSEKEVLEDYKRLSPQDKAYLMSSLRHVIYVFNSEYFEVPRKNIPGLDTIELTAKDAAIGKQLETLYGPFGKGVLSIRDYFSLFPSVEHAYAAFYHVLRRTWEKMRLKDVRDGHSLVMAFLILAEGTYHPEKVTL